MASNSFPSPSGLDDWRRKQVFAFARRMLSSCIPCPYGCGAMVCGDDQQVTHDLFHKSINKIKQDRDAIRVRLDLLEAGFSNAQAVLNQTASSLGAVSQDVVNLDNRCDTIETTLAEIVPNP